MGHVLVCVLRPYVKKAGLFTLLLYQKMAKALASYYKALIHFKVTWGVRFQNLSLSVWVIEVFRDEVPNGSTRSITLGRYAQWRNEKY